MNDLSPYERQLRLAFAGVEPLPNPSIPPREVMSSVMCGCSVVGHDEAAYVRSLRAFYDERGYPGFSALPRLDSISVRLSDFLTGLHHLKHMKAPPDRRGRPDDCAVLRCTDAGLQIDLPGGGTIIAIEQGALESEIRVLVSALEGLVRGLSKFATKDPLVTLLANDDHVALTCESLRVRIPHYPAQL